MYFKNPDDFVSNNPNLGPATEPYQSDFGRDWDVTWKDHKLSGSIFSEGEAYSQALQPVLDEIHEITGKRINNFGDASRGQGEGYQGRQHKDQFLEGLVNLNKLIKDDGRLQHLPLFTEELVQIRAGELARNARKEYEDNVKGMTWGSTLATITAEGYDMIRNPMGVATLAIGSTTPYGFTAKAFAKHFLYNALAEGTYGLFTRPTVKAWRDKAGIDYDTSQVIADIGIMAGGGGLFGIATNGVVSGVKSILPHVKGKLSRGEIKDPNGDSINEDLIEYVLRETEDEANIINDNPFTKTTTKEKLNGEKEHINRHNEALKILNEEDTALNLKDPVAPIENNLSKEQIQQITKPDEAVNFRPEEIEVDAKTFQFKSGGDEFGVSDRLKDIKTWEPHFAGQILVFENKNGKRFIVDGHQRLALAKRIKAKDPKQDPILSGFVFKEVDGFTPEQIKVIGALKNIAEGTGTPVDASRILRIDPDKFKTLPPRSQLARQGKHLASLSDDAFGLVINEKIPSNYASIIGKLVSDPSKHFPIAKVLIDNNPANEFQAEQIVRQALSSGFTQVKEQTLFGQEMLLQSLFKERATVLDNALRLLKQDKKVFNTLVRNHTRIEREGNQLLRDANKRKEMIDATAQEILKKEANKKGNLSDNLTAIAKEYKQTGNLGQATGEFVESIRRAVSEGNIDGDSVGGIGTTFETKEKIPLVPEQSEPIPGFDDVKKSKAVEQQGDQLQRITEEEIGVREGFEDDKAVRIDLKNKMQDDNFGTEQIIKHPAIISALEKAKTIPITVNDPNYGSVSWLEKRKFKMKNWSATGYIDGIDNHVLHAERLAWEEEDLIPESVLQDKKAIILIGAPASGKSSIANKIARKTKSAIVDSDEVKKSLPEYQDGLGGNALHLESKVIAEEILDESMKKGNNIITPIVGHTSTKVTKLQKRFKDQGYSVQLMYMDVKPEKVFNRMINRFIGTGRLIMPEYVLGIGNKPKITYNELKGKFDDFAEIDNNQAIGEQPTALEISNEQIIQGTGIRLRQVRPDSRRDATSTQEGIAEATLKELEVDLQKQKADSSIYDNVPIAQIIDDQEVLTTQSRTDILNEINQDKKMLNRLEDCA